MVFIVRVRILYLYLVIFQPSRALAQWYNCASTKYGSQVRASARAVAIGGLGFDPRGGFPGGGAGRWGVGA